MTRKPPNSGCGCLIIGLVILVLAGAWLYERTACGFLVFLVIAAIATVGSIREMSR